jgi:HlyD family secretion protein
VKKIIVLIIVLAAAGTITAVYLHETGLTLDNILGSHFAIFSRNGGRLKVSGNIEANEIRLSFQTPGKIAERLVDEGYFVKKNQVLARLDKDELMKIKEQAQADLDKAQSDYQLQQKEATRAANLLKDDAVTVQDNDVAQANFKVAGAKLLSARRALELAAIRFDYAELKSPIDGFITVRSADVGEVLQAGSPVYTIVDLNDVWLTAYINETDLGRVKLNQPVNVKTDTYPNKTYEGRISFISEEAEFTPKQIQTTEERVKLVYRIKIDLTNANLELKPGMPADGYIIE